MVLLAIRSPRATARGLASALLLALVAAGGAASAGVAELDAQHGFRDVRFGETFESFEGLRLLTDAGANGSSLFTRPADDLRYGEANLDGVTYGFYAGRLYFVTLFTSGERNGRAMLAELERSYGPGQSSSEHALEYVWQGSRVRLHYRMDQATSMGMAVLTSVEMDASVAADRASLPAAIAP